MDVEEYDQRLLSSPQEPAVKANSEPTNLGVNVSRTVADLMLGLRKPKDKTKDKHLSQNGKSLGQEDGSSTLFDLKNQPTMEREPSSLTAGRKR